MAQATPMLCARGADKAIEFYKKAFGAVEEGDRYVEGGKVSHAELRIEGALLMIADEFPEHNRSPAALGGTSVILNIVTQDVDGIAERSVAAGAKMLRGPEDHPYGRLCKVEDPFGHVWMFLKPPEPS